MGVLGSIVLSLPFVQTYFAKIATTEINEQFGTNISIDRMQVSLITWNASLKGVYVEDYKKDTLFHIDRLRTSILNVRNLIKGKLEFGRMDMERLSFKLKTYKDENQSNLTIFVDKLDNKKPRPPEKPLFHLSASGVTITDSHFRLINENKETGEILNFGDLDIDLDSFSINGPDVAANIQELSFHSSKGIRVERMATDFKYTKEQMRLDSLDIKTTQSHLIGNLVFDYDIEGMADFVNKV